MDFEQYWESLGISKGSPQEIDVKDFARQVWNATLEQVADKVATEADPYENPAMGEREEGYYQKCRNKADAFQDVIRHLANLKAIP